MASSSTDIESKHKDITRFCLVPTESLGNGTFSHKGNKITSFQQELSKRSTGIKSSTSAAGLLMHSDKSNPLTNLIEIASEKHGIKLHLGQEEESKIYSVCCSAKSKNKDLVNDLETLSQRYASLHSLSLVIEVNTLVVNEKDIFTRLSTKSKNPEHLINFLIWMKKNHAFSFSCEEFKKLLSHFNCETLVEKELKDYITSPKPKFTFLPRAFSSPSSLFSGEFKKPAPMPASKKRNDGASSDSNGEQSPSKKGKFDLYS